MVFLGRPLTLLRFDAPEYVLEDDHGAVRWRIRDGLLVARAGRGSGYLALDVAARADRADGDARSCGSRSRWRTSIPSIAAGFSTPVYEMTQSAIHVLVTHAFLRSLAKLELAESKVGRLADQAADSAPSRAERPALSRR